MPSKTDELRAQIALRLLKEQIRREREWRHPVNRLGRWLGGVARSVASGGWE
jgi:hypothetical protein